MDGCSSEAVAAMWERAIHSGLIDRDLLEMGVTGTDGYNIIILGHSAGSLHWKVRTGGQQRLNEGMNGYTECIWATAHSLI